MAKVEEDRVIASGEDDQPTITSHITYESIGRKRAQEAGCLPEILLFAISLSAVSYLINTGQSGILAILLQQTISSGALNILTSKI